MKNRLLEATPEIQFLLVHMEYFTKRLKHRYIVRMGFHQIRLSFLPLLHDSEIPESIGRVVVGL